jgi:hypothetical protein
VQIWRRSFLKVTFSENGTSANCTCIPARLASGSGKRQTVEVSASRNSGAPPKCRVNHHGDLCYLPNYFYFAGI